MEHVLPAPGDTADPGDAAGRPPGQPHDRADAGVRGVGGSGQWHRSQLAPVPGDLARLDALPEYQTSPLFTDAQRAALDYATELTRDKQVRPATFARLTRYYNEREICDIVWLVASEHLNNMTNIGLGIGSDGLCELAQQTGAAAKAVSRAAGTNASASR